MAPFRNPFGRKPPPLNGVTAVQDENTRPAGSGAPSDKGSLRGAYAESRASSSLSIKSKRDEPAEYKMSVVNDSGVYLPPSPPEKKSFWQRSQSTTSTPNHRALLSENEPFSISRESFDSYRRSFDISARSPILYPHDSSTPRQSQDSRTRPSIDSRTRSSIDSRFQRPPRPMLNGSDSFEPPKSADEEGFEDVGLSDETKLPPKKRGIFARFGDSSENPTSPDGARPSSSHRGFHLPGRKRGQSGTGAELANIGKPGNEGGEDGVV